MGRIDRILSHIRDNEPITASQISKDLGIPINTVYHGTHILRVAGKIKWYKELRGVFVLAKEEGEG